MNRPSSLLQILFVLCVGTIVSAQTTDATISGMVLDPSSRAIPDARILIFNDATGVRYSGATNHDGLYAVPYLPPGQYRVQISRDGFKTIIKPDIVLNVQSAVVLNFTLPVGATSETVTVDAGASQINTTDGSISTVVDRKFVENIPLNGRSFQDLILLTPGVVTNSSQQFGASGSTGEFSVNGQRTDSNVYSVDGVSANTGGYINGYGTPGTSGSLPAATALGTTQSLTSVDALQEFRVASSSYSAEYGLSPGGQFSFATRSGENQPHATLFDYLRNNFFDANDWFNDDLHLPINALRQNDFGGTFGGPVRLAKLYDGRNRSFFFTSFEGLRLTQPQSAITYYVPSIATRQNAATSLQSVLNAFPEPTGTALSNGLAPFVQTDSLASNINSTSVRFDHQAGPNLKLFFRAGLTSSTTATRYLAEPGETLQNSNSNTLGITTALSSHLAEEFRLNYTSNRGSTSTSLDSFGGAQPVNLFGLQGIDATATAGAEIGLYFPGYGISLSQFSTVQPQHSWNIVDGLSSSLGRNTFKVGVDFRKIGSRLQQSSPSVYSLFDSSQSLVDNSSFYSGVSVSGKSYPAYSNLALYAQDETKGSGRLSVSLGLRWEVNPAPSQTSGALPYIAEGDIAVPSSITLAPSGTKFWRTTFFNFAPRLGIAYQVRNAPDWQTVVRAGGGIFFDSGQQSSTQAFGNSPGQSASAAYYNVSYPLTSAQLAVSIVTPPVSPYYLTYYFPARLQMPYTWQWNLSLEQGIGRAQTMTISYVGSNGRRLLSQQLLTPGSANPNFTYLYDETSGTTSQYGALQVKLQRALSRGFQVLASYNWSHSIDYGSQNIDYPQIRGNSDFDVRQNFNLAATYDFHSASSRGVFGSLVDGWGIDTRMLARTGFPVILDGNVIANPNGQYGYSGLDLVPAVPLYLHVRGIAGNREVNPAAFSLPAANQEGNAPRNFARAFGANQMDVAVRRTFPIVDKLTLQFRAESFNILNHPNFGYIQPTYGNIQFGQATQMLNQSLGNLSPLYQQGGPRSTQFALKVAF